MSVPESTPPVDLSATMIDPDDPAYQPLLADLQGDILKPNGRDFAAYVVLQFTGPIPAVRSLLATLADRYVTSAAKQHSNSIAYRTQKNDAGVFGTLGLTVQAYHWLGFELSRIPRDLQARFLAGMNDGSTQQLLADPPFDCWEPWSRDTIHAILCLFDDHQGALGSVVAEVQSLVAGTAKVLSVQEGVRVRSAKGQPIEPFGYADGISQPLFLKHDLPAGTPDGSFDPSAPLSLVLIPDPNGAGPYSHGSFLVYRKLKQDVAGFNQDVKALAAKIGADPDLAGAYTIGRFKDGTPVVLSDVPTGQLPPDNSFQFALDPDGSRCPFQAHIRKTNPRGDTVRSNSSPLEVERSHRIVRRAFSFGTSAGSDETGLQFFCYQSDISNQFEFIQSAWANMTHFLRMTTGLDGIIGQVPLPPGSCTRPDSVPGGGQPWPNAWGNPANGTTTFDFGRWVSFRGGAYLFAPSISFLKGHAS